LIEADKAEFRRMLNAVMVIYYKPMLTNDALRVWWGKLEQYEFDEVTKAFDAFTNNIQQIPTPPTPADIKNLCQHKVTIHARLASPLSQEANQRHSNEVMAYVAKNIKPITDRRQWAKDLISGKKISNWDGAIAFAHEALAAKQ
jgi:hypothetical protein